MGVEKIVFSTDLTLIEFCKEPKIHTKNLLSIMDDNTNYSFSGPVSIKIRYHKNTPVDTRIHEINTFLVKVEI